MVTTNLKKKTRKEKKTKIREKKETCKTCYKSDLIHFCMTMCSAFYTDEPGRQCQYWENLCESFMQTIYWEAPKMLKQQRTYYFSKLTLISVFLLTLTLLFCCFVLLLLLRSDCIWLIYFSKTLTTRKHYKSDGN